MAQTPQDLYHAAHAMGQRAAWLELLALALQRLGYATDMSHHARLGYVVEREEAIAMLRDLCATWGDNDWSEHLHLADILDKHLGRHLDRGMCNDG